MIELASNTILILSSDGRSAPFDPRALRKLIAECCAEIGSNDPSIPRDVTLAVEYAIRSDKSHALAQHSSDSPDISYSVPVEQIDNTVIRILQNIGLFDAAEHYRKSSSLREHAFLIPFNHITLFLQNELRLEPGQLDFVASKVFNSLSLIGGSDADRTLILSLARHFLRTRTEQHAAPVQKPDFSTPRGELEIRPEDILTLASPDASNAVATRRLALHSIRLRIFPVIRMDLRLTSFTEHTALVPPLTELALGESIARTAAVIDDLCKAADTLCIRMGHDADTPLKLILHLSDASIFTREWMGCKSVQSAERCAFELAGLLTDQLIRQPIKCTSS